MKHIITTMALLSAGAASAMTGNTLLQRMTGSEVEKVAALSYIAGISSGLDLGGVLCFPRGVTVGQGYEIVKKALEAYPSTRHEDAGLLSYIALNQVFPCKKPAAKTPRL